MTTHQDINDFARFALDQLDNGGAELSMDELYEMWRSQTPNPAEFAENVAAVDAAIKDYKNGDRGRPAGELSHELRKELGDTANK